MDEKSTQEEMIKALRIMNYNSLEYMSSYPKMTLGMALIRRIYPQIEEIIKEWFKLKDVQCLKSKLVTLENIEKEIAETE